MTRPSSTWKSIERQLAALFGAKRYGPQGEDVPDFAFKLTPQVRIRFEVKHGKHIPKKLQQAVQQVKESRLPRTEVEVATELRGVMMHPHGAPLEDTLVVLPLADWIWITSYLGGTYRELEQLARPVRKDRRRALYGRLMDA